MSVCLEAATAPTRPTTSATALLSSGQQSQQAAVGGSVGSVGPSASSSSIITSFSSAASVTTTSTPAGVAVVHQSGAPGTITISPSVITSAAAHFSNASAATVVIPLSATPLAGNNAAGTAGALSLGNHVLKTASGAANASTGAKVILTTNAQTQAVALQKTPGGASVPLGGVNITVVNNPAALAKALPANVSTPSYTLNPSVVKCGTSVTLANVPATAVVLATAASSLGVGAGNGVIADRATGNDVVTTMVATGTTNIGIHNVFVKKSSPPEGVAPQADVSHSHKILTANAFPGSNVLATLNAAPVLKTVNGQRAFAANKVKILGNVMMTSTQATSAGAISNSSATVVSITAGTSKLQQIQPQVQVSQSGPSQHRFYQASAKPVQAQQIVIGNGPTKFINKGPARLVADQKIVFHGPVATSIAASTPGAATTVHHVKSTVALTKNGPSQAAYKHSPGAVQRTNAGLRTIPPQRPTVISGQSTKANYIGKHASQAQKIKHTKAKTTKTYNNAVYMPRQQQALYHQSASTQQHHHATSVSQAGSRSTSGHQLQQTQVIASGPGNSQAAVGTAGGAAVPIANAHQVTFNQALTAQIIETLVSDTPYNKINPGNAGGALPHHLHHQTIPQFNIASNAVSASASAHHGQYESLPPTMTSPPFSPAYVPYGAAYAQSEHHMALPPNQQLPQIVGPAASISRDFKACTNLDTLSFVCQAVLLDHNYNATLPSEKPMSAIMSPMLQVNSRSCSFDLQKVDRVISAITTSTSLSSSSVSVSSASSMNVSRQQLQLPLPPSAGQVAPRDDQSLHGMAPAQLHANMNGITGRAYNTNVTSSNPATANRRERRNSGPQRYTTAGLSADHALSLSMPCGVARRNSERLSSISSAMVSSSNDEMYNTMSCDDEEDDDEDADGASDVSDGRKRRDDTEGEETDTSPEAEMESQAAADSVTTHQTQLSLAQHQFMPSQQQQQHRGVVEHDMKQVLSQTQSTQPQQLHNSQSMHSSPAPAGHQTGPSITSLDTQNTYDDYVTRCICGFLHDDGYMIECDKCKVWQHVRCVLRTRKVPDDFLCEQCDTSKKLDQIKARQLQQQWMREIQERDIRLRKESLGAGGLPPIIPPGTMARNSDSDSSDNDLTISSGGGGPHQARANAGAAGTKRRKDTVAGRRQARGPRPKRKERKVPSKRAKNSKPTPQQDALSTTLAMVSAQLSEADNKIPQLRQWIENYEEAVTNHYSPELRARIANIRAVGENTILGRVESSVHRCKVQTIPPGVKCLVASGAMAPATPVLELRGKYMLSTQQRTPARLQRPGPFMFFHQLMGAVEVCVDTRTYGNNARFIRRSCTPNAELKHVIEKGALHLYVVTTTVVEKGAELTIGHDAHELGAGFSSLEIPCACSTPQNCALITSKTTSLSTALLSPNSGSTVAIGSASQTVGQPSIPAVTPVQPRRTTTDQRTENNRKRRGRHSRDSISVSTPSPNALTGLTAPPIINNNLGESVKVEEGVDMTPVIKQELTDDSFDKQPDNSVTNILMSSIEADLKLKSEQSVTVMQEEEIVKEESEDRDESVVKMGDKASLSLMSPDGITRGAGKRETKREMIKTERDSVDGNDCDRSDADNGKVSSATPVHTRRTSRHTSDEKDHSIEDNNNKKLSREERKLQAIVKAIERLERQEQRKQENQAKQAAHRRESDGGRDGSNTTPPVLNTSTPHSTDPLPPMSTSNTSNNSSTAIDSLETGLQNHPTSDSQETSNVSLLSTPVTTSTSNSREDGSQALSAKMKRRRKKGRTRTTSTNSNRRTRLDSVDSIHSSDDTMQSPPPPASSSIATSPTKAAGLLLALAQNASSSKSPPPGVTDSNSNSAQSSPETHLSSACLLLAAAVEPLEPGGFKFPKTKKGLMNEWLNKSDLIQPASAISPSSLTAHLPSPTTSLTTRSPIDCPTTLQLSKNLVALAQAASFCSGDSGMGSLTPTGMGGASVGTLNGSVSVGNTCGSGSAKKRWLRQAISEDQCDSPPSSNNVDLVAPPKKRRIPQVEIVSHQHQPEDDDAESPQAALSGSSAMEADSALQEMAAEMRQEYGNSVHIVSSVSTSPEGEQADTDTESFAASGSNGGVAHDVPQLMHSLMGDADDDTTAALSALPQPLHPLQLSLALPPPPAAMSVSRGALMDPRLAARLNAEQLVGTVEKTLSLLGYDEAQHQQQQQNAAARRLELATPAKRKLSITEYRQRKKLNTNDRNDEVLLADESNSSQSSPKPLRNRSNSSSSATSGVSTDLDEMPTTSTINSASDPKDSLNAFNCEPTELEKQRELGTMRLKKVFGLSVVDESRKTTTLDVESILRGAELPEPIKSTLPLCSPTFPIPGTGEHSSTATTGCSIPHLEASSVVGGFVPLFASDPEPPVSATVPGELFAELPATPPPRATTTLDAAVLLPSSGDSNVSPNPHCNPEPPRADDCENSIVATRPSPKAVALFYSPDDEDPDSSKSKKTTMGQCDDAASAGQQLSHVADALLDPSTTNSPSYVPPFNNPLYPSADFTYGSVIDDDEPYAGRNPSPPPNLDLEVDH